MTDFLNSPRGVEGIDRPTVVIVDKEPLYCWFVAEALDARGLRVVSFVSVADATEYLEHDHRSDLLLVDGQTVADEGVSGLAALSIQAHALPCVLLGACAPAAVGADVDGVLIVEKPKDVDTLVGLVENRLHLGT